MADERQRNRREIAESSQRNGGVGVDCLIHGSGGGERVYFKVDSLIRGKNDQEGDIDRFM